MDGRGFVAQVKQHPRNIQANRTDVSARPAQRAGARQIRPVVKIAQTWSQDRAHRAWIGVAVRVTADARIDRTHVHAGAAPDATEDLCTLARHETRPSVVEQDNVQRLRSTLIARSSWTADERCVSCQLLTGSRSSQQLEKSVEIGKCRNELLDPHQYDMHPWQRRHHSPVAFVRDETNRARFHDAKVGTGDAHVGVEEDLAKTLARISSQRRRIVASAVSSAGRASPVPLACESGG